VFLMYAVRKNFSAFFSTTDLRERKHPHLCN
jgi:hypothetical protein